MKHDLNQIDTNHVIAADICIVGAGAAGISIAKTYINTQVSVALLESGGFDYDDDTQSLYKGAAKGNYFPSVQADPNRYPIDTSRLRFFGGSTNHWTGSCAPLDPLDFAKRDWVPHSGWPVTRDQMEPYYRRAHALCELGDYEYGPDLWKFLQRQEFAYDYAKIESRFLRRSPPTRFGIAYRAELVEARNIHVYTHANVAQIIPGAAAKAIESLEVTTLSGRRARVQAKYYVLACGGLENPRILLNSNRVIAQGVGNQHDNVGRYFMDHPHVSCGKIVAKDAEALLRQYAVNLHGSHPTRPVIHLPEQAQIRHKVGNGTIALDPTEEEDTNQGVAAARDLIDGLRPAGKLPPNVAKTLWTIITDLDDVAAAAYRRLKGEPVVLTDKIELFSVVEHTPNRDSRVALSDEKDALGLRRINVEWRLSELDKSTIRTLATNLAEEFGRLDVGRVQLDDWTLDHRNSWPQKLWVGYHHMGTTRMSEDPKFGVVDQHCRVHGIDNLFIAGSSVFPTSGWANPTLTLTALSLRLADHLKSKL